MTKRKNPRLGFIGGGNMATALVRGLLANGWSSTSVAVAEPLAAKRAVLRKRYRIETTSDNSKACAGADIVILAVKPQMIDAVAVEIAAALGPRTLVVSIAAGVRLARLQDLLGDTRRVVRVMPNTPCLVGKGASVVCGGEHATRADVRRVKTIFSAVGRAWVVDDEELLDAVTGLSGSGPAYLYRFAEALIAAGVHVGLDADLSRELTYQTLLGASAMLVETGEEPRALREAVSSPGGTTVAGLAALDEAGFMAAVEAAVHAATRRSRELAG